MNPAKGINVVDSCGWLEYFANGDNAGFFAPILEATESLIVPSLSVFEVCNRVGLRQTASRAGFTTWMPRLAAR